VQSGRHPLQVVLLIRWLSGILRWHRSFSICLLGRLASWPVILSRTSPPSPPFYLPPPLTPTHVSGSQSEVLQILIYAGGLPRPMALLFLWPGHLMWDPYVSRGRCVRVCVCPRTLCNHLYLHRHWAVVDGNLIFFFYVPAIMCLPGQIFCAVCGLSWSMEWSWATPNAMNWQDTSAIVNSSRGVWKIIGKYWKKSAKESIQP